MTITALPAAPSTSDPTNFATQADALLAALATFVTEANALAVAMNLNSTTDTSASSVAIGTGAKTFTVTAGKSFQPGMYLVIADTAAPSTNSMYGQITSYSTDQLVMNITGIVGSGTKTAWTISQSASNAYALAADTATTANRTDSSEVTVTAHATTGDIFAAAANSILWDDAGGAITTTAFPAASKAGLVRDCRCNGASKFTAGANLEIEGVPSGTTVTLADKASFTVRAITTTLHRMTYSVSGTFTVTGTGFTVNPTATATFNIEDGFANISIPEGALQGTSNASTFTITGLPACLATTANKVLPFMDGTDNTAATYIAPRVVGNVIELHKTHISVGFTGSGTKALGSGEFSYRIP